jgi:hypothetical protein
MKQKALFTIYLLLSLSCFGMKKYTIPKDDFLKQISVGLKSDRIYCYKEDGSKVWLLFNKSTTLTIQLLNNGKKEVMLHTVKYQNGIIEAIEFNIWWTSKKIYTINIDEVHSFYIVRKTTNESEMSYFNIDSSRAVVRLKNDSLKSNYLSRDEYMISWVAKAGAKKDSLRIRENACYHMGFKDNSHTEYGVVQKITADSIYISNTFNQEWATANGKEYKVYGYAVQDIIQLSLLKAGGFSYKVIKAEDYDVITTKANKNVLSLPYWFAINPSTGEQEFYRSWLTERGFIGIMEKEGRVYWYEGN